VKAKLRDQRGSTGAAARARAKTPDRSKTVPVARDAAVLSKALPRAAQPNRAQAAINLQRTIGNQAVLRLLRQSGSPTREPTRPPSTAALAPPAAPAAEARSPRGAKEKPEASDQEQLVGKGVEAGAAAAAAEPAAAPPAAKANAEERRTPGSQRPAEEKGAEVRAPAVAEEPPAQQGARPGAQAPRSPKEDPAFQAVAARVRSVAGDQRRHAPAQAKAAEAQAAAVGPANEVASQAAAAQVGKMGAQEPQPFDKSAFKAALLQKIRSLATPSNLEQVEQFKKSGKAASVKEAVVSQVDAGKAAAQGPIKQATEEAPSTAGIQAKPVTPLPASSAGPAVKTIGAAAAAPKAKPAAAVSLDASSRSLDRQMADEDVTDEQLKTSNEPDFRGALEAKTRAQRHSQAAPAAFRKEEKPLLASAQAQAEATAQAAVAGMHAARAEALAKAGGQQQAAKGKDELARAKVASRIQDIYQATKQKVEARLKTLDDSVGSLFDKGAEQAAQDFTSHLDARFSVWRAERYGSNPALWLLDKIKGPPQEVDKFFVEARDLYIRRMDTAIDKVAAAVQAGLTEAKALIAAGWQEVQTYVRGLPVDLRKVGEQAAEQIQGSFDQLRQSVDDRRDQLIDRLAQKYVENLKAIDERIRQRKEENKGLFDDAKAAMAGVIETIRNLRQMLTNVLAKAAAAVKKIIKDPIGFLRNLIAGVKQGLQRFVGNIASHLQKGLMGWLFGALGEAGLEIPEKLDLRGIIGLALQVLGVTYAFFRKRAVALLGEPVVHRLEQVAEVFKVLVTEGAAGLWRFIADKVGDIKSMVVDGIMSFVRNSIIVAGLTWVLSLLNPASAFVKACKLIYDIIMFFVERGSQIMALVNAVIGSVQAIAAGAIGVAAAAVENALARAVPVAISFLASLLGLTGVGKAVRKIIEKAQAPIGKAMDWLIHQAAKLIKKAGKSVGQAGVPKDPKARLRLAGRSAKTIVRALSGRVTRPVVEASLTAVRVRYGLSSLEPFVRRGTWWVRATINPSDEVDTEKSEETRPGGSGLAERVKELHQKTGALPSKVTFAGAEGRIGGSQVRVFGRNPGGKPKGRALLPRKAYIVLQKHEWAARRGDAHPDVFTVEELLRAGVIPERVSATTGVCPKCAAFLHAARIQIIGRVQRFLPRDKVRTEALKKKREPVQYFIERMTEIGIFYKRGLEARKTIEKLKAYYDRGNLAK
jgi:hypothetical protein